MQGIGLNDRKYYSFQKFDEGEYMDDGGVYTIFDSASDNIYISALWYDRLMQLIALNVWEEREGYDDWGWIKKFIYTIT